MYNHRRTQRSNDIQNEPTNLTPASVASMARNGDTVSAVMSAQQDPPTRHCRFEIFNRTQHSFHYLTQSRERSWGPRIYPQAHRDNDLHGGDLRCVSLLLCACV